MATAAQPVYYVTAPIGQQPHVVIQTQPQTQAPQQLYLRRTHKILSIMQMIVGCLCFALEVIGICVGPANQLTYTGIFTGIFFTITGVLGFLAFKKNNKCLLVACMVMSILSAVFVCSTGVTAAMMEMFVHSRYFRSESKRRLQNVKESSLVGACCFEFIVSIIHASTSCASCCSCCWPVERQPAPVSRAVPATVIVQQPNRMDAQPSTSLVLQQQNAPTAVEMKASGFPPSGQETVAFPASNLYGASSASPPPYQE